MAWKNAYLPSPKAEGSNSMAALDSRATGSWAPRNDHARKAPSKMVVRRTNSSSLLDILAVAVSSFSVCRSESSVNNVRMLGQVLQSWKDSIPLGQQPFSRAADIQSPWTESRHGTHTYHVPLSIFYRVSVRVSLGANSASNPGGERRKSTSTQEEWIIGSSPINQNSKTTSSIVNAPSNNTYCYCTCVLFACHKWKGERESQYVYEYARVQYRNMFARDRRLGQFNVLCTKHKTPFGLPVP